MGLIVNPVGIAILVGSFFLLLFLKLPVAFCLGFSAMISAWYMGISLGAVTQRMVAGVDSFALLAIPFFIFAGEIMGAGGISDRLVKLADVLVGRVRGGLGCVNVLNSTFFATIQGSAVANVASIGPIELRMMRKAGYPDTFTVPVTMASSIQSVITPPSHNMIIFATAVGGLSVGRLFIAGILPGLVLALALLLQVLVTSHIRGYPKGNRYSLKEAVFTALDCLPAFFTIVIILGGVFLGIVTANESAVLACAYALVICLTYYKGIKVKDLWPILKRVLRTLAMVLSLIAASSAFGFMMTILHIPSLVTNMLLGLTENRILLLLLINLMLLVIGSVMDMAPMILITAPILLPVVTGPVIGMDPIQFGIVMLFNLALGLMTPPVGTVLFVASGISGLKIETLIKSMLPFYLVMLAVLLVFTFVPAVSLTLPNLMFGE
ncbi:MAG: TRAP transporter large permease [Spirochaetes bacterium]|nr:TRAP transporter large permease [Spirochaetota bacterium]